MDKSAGQKLDVEEFVRWYAHKRYRKTGRQPSNHTIQCKRAHVLTAAQLTGASDLSELGTLLASRGDLELLLDRLSVRMTSGTMRNAVYALRDFGNFAVAKGWITSHAFQETDIPPKNPMKPITVHSTEEMEVFVNAARGKGLRWWLLCMFIVDSSRRIGEALNLRWDQLRLTADGGYFELPVNKAGEPQYIPLSRRMLAVLTPENIAALKAETKGQFGGRFGKSPEIYLFPWHYSTAMGRLQRFSASIGITYRGWHNYRHSVITDRLERGIPIQAVSVLAGHTNIATTMNRYAHVTSLSYWKLIEPNTP